jgi:ParB/RepB/Spo0J family partition protein
MSIAATGQAASRTQSRQAIDVRTAFVHPHPLNPRKNIDLASDGIVEMAASMVVHGVLEPLLVQPHPSRGPGHYQLLAGHRRLIGARVAPLATVPVVVRTPVPDAVALEMTLIENVLREDLDPVEKAEAMNALQRKGRTIKQIAERTGFAESTVSRYLTLMALAPETRERPRRLVRNRRRRNRPRRAQSGPQARNQTDRELQGGARSLRGRPRPRRRGRGAMRARRPRRAAPRRRHGMRPMLGARHP